MSGIVFDVWTFLEGPQLPKKIRALASYRDYTFAAYGNDIGVFKRAHQVRHSYPSYLDCKKYCVTMNIVI